MFSFPLWNSRKRKFHPASIEEAREYAQDATQNSISVLDTRENLETFLRSPTGVGLDGNWRGSPMPPLWSRYRDLVSARLPQPYLWWPKNRKDDPHEFHTYFCNYIACGQEQKPKIEHLAEVFQRSYVKHFEKPFHDVVESINAGDFDHLQTVFGRNLWYRTNAWAEKWRQNNLELRIETDAVAACKYKSIVSLVRASASDSLPFEGELASLDGFDVDWVIEGLPDFFSFFTKIPKWHSPLIRTARFGPLAYVCSSPGGFRSAALAIHVLFITKEKIEIIDKTTGKTLYKDPEFVLKNHLWKFGTKVTRDSMSPFLLYDMNDLVQESTEQFFDEERKRGIKYQNDPYFFPGLINRRSLDPEWWIESRKSTSRADEFERSWGKIDGVS